MGLLGGCASVSRSLSYGTGLADAHPMVDGRAYRIYIHPTDPTILMQRPLGTAVGQGFVQGATLGIAAPGTAYDPWKQAADAFLAPVGCTASDVYSLGQGTWEARYSCPAGVDLRALVMAQRQALRSGAPLRPN